MWREKFLQVLSEISVETTMTKAHTIRSGYEERGSAKKPGAIQVAIVERCLNSPHEKAFFKVLNRVNPSLKLHTWAEFCSIREGNRPLLVRHCSF
jgi:hypothetical protein